MIYAPHEDSYLLASAVKENAKGKLVLDIGTGSGIQAQSAKLAGAKSIVASDIDQNVVNHVKKLGIKAIKSNLFDKVAGKFDLIVFNPPYLPKDDREDPESALSTTGGKNGDEIILRFLKQAKARLNSKGIILLLISSLTPKNRISKLLKKQGMEYEVVAQKKLFFESLYVWKICEKQVLS